jgi:CubicO group peptidase (beta-lactamase class C family)
MSLPERMEFHNTPGVSIAVINNFEIEWAKGYGVVKAGSSATVTPDTLFQAASLGKPVVAVAALHYVDQGILSLDQDVNERLTSWQVPENEFSATEPVTLRRLLSHSAGVTLEGFRGYEQGSNLPDLLQILQGIPPANSGPIIVDAIPGSRYRYSGGGYMIVQQLMEDVTRQPFSEVMAETVLEPWGMVNSTFDYPLPSEMRPMAASGHRSDGNVIPGGWFDYPEMGSGASLWSTSPDLAHFAIGLMQAYLAADDPVLSKTAAIQILTPGLENRGLGPLVYDEGGDRFYFMHPGHNYGYKAVMVAYPKRGQGVVIMTNSENGDALWREILNSVSIEYGWVPDRSGLYLTLSVILLAVIFVIGWRWQRRKA